jgi:hypothetical protein
MMDTSSNRPVSQSDRSLWLPLVLVGLALVLRAVKSTEVGADWLPNFSPWMALAFAGTALFPRQFSGWWVLGLLILVDGLFQSSVWLSYPLTLAAVYACFALAAMAAMRLRASIGAGGVILGVLGCSVGFYLVTNTLSWWLSPEYVKSASGWLQALTVGLPGFPPTWTFLRNSLLSDLGFSTLLILAHNVEATAKALPRLGWRVEGLTCGAKV